MASENQHEYTTNAATCYYEQQRINKNQYESTRSIVNFTFQCEYSVSRGIRGRFFDSQKYPPRPSRMSRTNTICSEPYSDALRFVTSVTNVPRMAFVTHHGYV